MTHQTQAVLKLAYVLMVICIMALASGCGKSVSFTSVPSVCTTSPVAGGQKITCPGGSTGIIYDGQQGIAGEQGPQGATGPQGIAGVAGAVGPQGPQGAAGATGAQGPQGVQGVAGLPGTVITPVQFCPASFQAVYPSKFPEYGLCINNQMYGVYSANGGFLAFLPQGQYNSNGIDASCTFTIGANCQVQ